jgi:hypothetical protein
LADLEEKGMIKKVVAHSKLNIYSMSNLHRLDLDMIRMLINYSSCGRCRRIEKEFPVFTNDVTICLFSEIDRAVDILRVVEENGTGAFAIWAWNFFSGVAYKIKMLLQPIMIWFLLMAGYA